MKFLNILKNRFARFILSTILQIIAVVLCYYFIADQIISFLFASFAVGMVGLILFDLLDIGFMNKTAGRIVKLVIFYVVLFAAIGLCFGTDYPEAVRLGETFSEKMGFGNAFIVCLSSSTVPLVATAVTVFTRTEYFDEMRYPVAFSVAIGYVASAIISLLLGLAFQNGVNAAGAYIVSLVIGLVILVLVTVFLGLPFDYENNDWWCLKDVIFHHRRHHYSSSGYSSSSSSSSYGRSSSSSSSTAKKPAQRTQTTTTYVDDRKDGAGKLSTAMRSLANRNSKSHGLSYYSRVDFSISSSVSPGTIKFTLSYTVHVSSSVTNESQVQVISNDLDGVIESVANDLSSGAQEELDRLRDKYVNYDGAYSIDFAQGSVRTVQD